MSEFKEISPREYTGNPFQAIGGDWTLITAQKDGKVNTMTASWGGQGVMWGQDVVFIFVRQSRFTKEFIDDSDYFSVTIYDPAEQRQNMSYLGTTSGRDEDKIAHVGYHVEMDGEIPYFAEAKTVFLCKKLSRHYIAPEGMINDEILPKWYADEDYHDMYIGKIEKVLVRD